MEKNDICTGKREKAPGTAAAIKKALADIFIPLGYVNRLGRMDIDRVAIAAGITSNALKASMSHGVMSAGMAWRLARAYRATSGQELDHVALDAFVS